MFKIGITGQAGFIGTHLFNTVGLSQNVFTKVPFQKDFFLKPSKLRNFVKECDAIIHLAGVNRHNDPETLYKINIEGDFFWRENEVLFDENSEIIAIAN